MVIEITNFEELRVNPLLAGGLAPPLSIRVFDPMGISER